ncbi:MAG: hypothetical protein H0X25_20840, partial [Acidobacteriales bacterium]|nr:hypothetical protein [Terriglobales bacterium]
LGTVAVGLVWRVVCINLFQTAIRHFNVSWADDTPSAWFALQANSRNRVSQIAVQLDDGTWLRCDDARQFDDAPFGPCILGTDGDVALYLTHEELAGQEARELKTVRDSQWGDRLTYVPVGRIRRMTIRHKR